MALRGPPSRGPAPRRSLAPAKAAQESAGLGERQAGDIAVRAREPSELGLGAALDRIAARPGRATRRLQGARPSLPRRTAGSGGRSRRPCGPRPRPASGRQPPPSRPGGGGPRAGGASARPRPRLPAWQASAARRRRPCRRRAPSSSPPLSLSLLPPPPEGAQRPEASPRQGARRALAPSRRGGESRPPPGRERGRAPHRCGREAPCAGAKRRRGRAPRGRALRCGLSGERRRERRARAKSGGASVLEERKRGGPTCAGRRRAPWSGRRG